MRFMNIYEGIKTVLRTIKSGLEPGNIREGSVHKHKVRIIFEYLFYKHLRLKPPLTSALEFLQVPTLRDHC